MKLFQLTLLFFLVLAICGCKTTAASAEEYYSLGMAYFELGNYEEAEKWLNRARESDRTMVASQYNLGRIAFERQRYSEAAEYFESILTLDQYNVPALQAAAYTRIRTGEIAAAERHYSRLLELVPENADNGYNHALVLHAMGNYSGCEEVLNRYRLSMLENSEMQLLYARSQAAQNKVEAIDSYSLWLDSNSNAKVRFEYAEVLEQHELYARALEEYRKTLSEISSSDDSLKRSDIHFALAKLQLIADSESIAGITDLQNAVDEGFDNIDAIEELLLNENISSENLDSIRHIADNMRRTDTEEEENF